LLFNSLGYTKRTRSISPVSVRSRAVCVTVILMFEPVHLVAHRGYAARYPENTESALMAAVAAGARYVEFDVQLTRDGVPILLHDEGFLRTAGRPVDVHAVSMADLDNFDVGEAGRFGSRFERTPVCDLRTAAELLAGWPQVTAFVELKRHSLSRVGIAKVFDAVLPILEPVLSQCVVISFVAEALQESRRRCDAPVGWAVRTWNEASRRQAEDIQPEYLFCNVDKLPADPANIWQGPWQWVIYEITDPDQALQLARSGMSFIETMQFGEMHAALKERGAL